MEIWLFNTTDIHCGSCGSGFRSGYELFGKSVVWSPAPPVHKLNCYWAPKILNPKLLPLTVLMVCKCLPVISNSSWWAPCIAACAISICVNGWMWHVVYVMYFAWLKYYKCSPFTLLKTWIYFGLSHSNNKFWVSIHLSRVRLSTFVLKKWEPRTRCYKFAIENTRTLNKIIHLWKQIYKDASCKTWRNIYADSMFFTVFFFKVLLLTNFKHCPEDEECPVPEEVRDTLGEFHNDILLHCGKHLLILCSIYSAGVSDFFM